VIKTRKKEKKESGVRGIKKERVSAPGGYRKGGKRVRAKRIKTHWNDRQGRRLIQEGGSMLVLVEKANLEDTMTTSAPEQKRREKRGGTAQSRSAEKGEGHLTLQRRYCLD